MIEKRCCSQNDYISNLNSYFNNQISVLLKKIPNLTNFRKSQKKEFHDILPFTHFPKTKSWRKESLNIKLLKEHIFLCLFLGDGTYTDRERLKILGENKS